MEAPASDLSDLGEHARIMPENSVVTRVRIGDASSLELFAVLDPGRTLREGLERVLTRAHEVAAIPRSVRLDDPEISIDGRRVDPDEVGTRIPELTEWQTPMVVVRTQTTPLRLKIRLSPKGLKGTPPDPGSHDVLPSEPVGAELDRIGLMSSVEGREWFRRAPSSVRDLRVEWHGPDGKRRVLDLDRPWWEQGVRTSGELRVGCRVRWEWPPRPTLPPPWSGFSIGVVLLAAILAIGWYWLMWEPDQYAVTFRAPREYGKTNVVIRSGGSLPNTPLSLESPDTSQTVNLQPGSHRLRITPQFAPPFDSTIVLEGRVSERHVDLPNDRPRSVRTVLSTELRYLEEDNDNWVPGNEIDHQALLNGYEVEPTDWLSGSPDTEDVTLVRRAGGLHWLTFVRNDKTDTLRASRARIDMEIIVDGLGGAPFRLPIVIPEGAGRYLIWTNVSIGEREEAP